MIELPEALTLGRQLREAVAGKTVARALPPTKVHKFCWFQGDPAAYDGLLRGAAVTGAESFGAYVELVFDRGLRLALNDGVCPRLLSGDAPPPKDYQLLLSFTDGARLCFTVAMYGGICLHRGTLDNVYYQKSLNGVSPLSPDFPVAFRAARESCKDTLSAKAFLATEQRFPGLGNGVCQDILFAAGLHPKRKLATLSAADWDRLAAAVPAVLGHMAAMGGRDTEKDLFGVPGGYRTSMSKHTLAAPCPVCGGPVSKEAYLGGSVYYCAHCQPLIK